MVKGSTLGNEISLAIVFVNLYYGGKKRNAVKQESGRSGNMEMRRLHSQGEKHAETLFLLT